MFYREALCSALIVGLGQILKGEGNKGLLLILIFYFAIPSIVYLSLIISGPLFILVIAMACIATLGLWFYSVYDALKTAQKT